MGKDSVPKHTSPPKTGKHDFFKLLVWDLILNAMLRRVDDAALDQLLAEMRPMSRSSRMNLVVDKIKQADIAVLVETPAEGIPGLDEQEFWTVRASSQGSFLNTVILARRSLFKQPNPQLFYTGDQVDHRMIGCTLVPQDGSREIHVLGIHSSGKGHELDISVKKLEKAIRPDTVLLGDFNMDLSKKAGPWGNYKHVPSLAKLVEQAKYQPKHLATTNKQRSPFQAQLSKMFMQDFSMKDFAFLGERFCHTKLHGPITRQQLLPNAETPSDHTPLSFDLSFQASN